MTGGDDKIYMGMYRPSLQEVAERGACPVCQPISTYGLSLRALHLCWIAGHFDRPVYETIDRMREELIYGPRSKRQ